MCGEAATLVHAAAYVLLLLWLLIGVSGQQSPLGMSGVSWQAHGPTPKLPHQQQNTPTSMELLALGGAHKLLHVGKSFPTSKPALPQPITQEAAHNIRGMHTCRRSCRCGSPSEPKGADVGAVVEGDSGKKTISGATMLLHKLLLKAARPLLDHQCQVIEVQWKTMEIDTPMNIDGENALPEISLSDLASASKPHLRQDIASQIDQEWDKTARKKLLTKSPSYLWQDLEGSLLSCTIGDERCKKAED
ncbi:hypothetical protein BKA62DRAFT_677543 [Auriculariales sp. MPI-PUGE-AT-0066]|nr:hypothetical protein BKA62DRAFT_677543 [Auriculariales sp. MPI-PUGE-AT-0066]